MGAVDAVVVLCFPHTAASSVCCCWERHRGWYWDRHSRQIRVRETCSSSSVRQVRRHGVLPPEHTHQDSERLQMLRHFLLRHFLLEGRVDTLAQAELYEDGPEGEAMQGNGSSAHAAVVRAFGVLDGGTSKARFGLSHAKSRDLYNFRISRNLQAIVSYLEVGDQSACCCQTVPVLPAGI